MADQTTSYQIAVKDGVDPAIERKLIAVSTAATNAGSSCAQLQSQIDRLNASGIGSVSQAMRDAATAQKQFQSSSASAATSINGATRATSTLTTSLFSLRNSLAATIPQLQVLTTTVQGFSQAARQASQAANPAAGGFNALGQGANAAAGGTRNMNAVLGLARGNITSANRLAGSFLSTLVGSGPIIAAAFSVLGALALVAVLAEVAQAIYHVVEAYKAQELASRRASDQAILDGERIIKVQASMFTAANAARLLHGDSLSTDDVTVQSAQAALKQLSYQREILASQNALNQAGLTGDALAKARVTSAQNELNLAKQQKAAADNLTNAYRAQLEATHTVDTTLSSGEGARDNVVQSSKQTLNITDDKQVKAIQDQMRTAKQASDDLGTSIVVLTNNLAAAGKKEGLASVKDAAKDARLEMQQLEAAYKDYVTTLNHKVTPQETLDYWQTAEAHLRHYAANIDAVNAKEAGPLQAIASRNDNLGRTNESLDEQITNIGAYSDALKEKQQLDKLTLEYQKTGIPLTATETATLKDKIATIVENAAYQAELNSQYTAAAGPLRTYIAAQQALAKLMADDPANAAQYTAQLNIAKRAYTDATQPLAEYSHGIQHQILLLGQYGTALTVASELQQVSDILRARGQSLNQDQLNSLRESLTQLEEAKQVQADINAMYEKNAGALEKLTIAQRANNEAYLSGVIGAGQYKDAALAAGLAQAQLANDRDLGTWSTRLETSLGELAKGFTGVADGAQKAFTGFFSTLDNGFADSIGHAIAFGGSVKTALLDTARQAVAGLISSLIKLAIQYLITTALAKAFNIQLPKENSSTSAKETLAGTAAAIASIAAVTTAQYTAINLLTAPAWDLAEAVSLFSFGANAVPAEAGIAAVVAAGQAAKYATGGYVSGPGTSTSDSIPARLSTGEYVVNAKATAEHHNLLDTINSNRRVSKFAAGGYVAGTAMVQQSYVMQSNTNGPKLVIEDHTAGVKFIPGGHSDDEVRVIARQVVQSDADGVVGNALNDGNSQTRKALHNNTTAKPQR